MNHLKQFMRHFPNCRYLKQFGVTLSLCIGLMVAAPSSYAQIPQGDTSTASGSADQAYREVIAKNYNGAIQDFQKALAADPSNTSWRKDLGFAYLAAGFQEAAATEFASVYSEHPDDFEVGLQLGYLSQQLDRADDAGKYFEAVARNGPAELSTQAKQELAVMQVSQLRDRKRRGGRRPRQ